MDINCLNFLERTAELFPNKKAVFCKDKSLTFNQLEANSKKLSCKIPNNKRNSPVAVFLPKGCDTIVSFIAVLYSGNFYAPIDVKTPINRFKQILKSLDPFLIITNTSLKSKISDISDCSILNIDEVDFTNIDKCEIDNWKHVIDTNPVYCMHTSGSTGNPKGVLIPHKAVIDYIEWTVQNYQIDSNNRIANQVPFHFDISTLDIFLMLYTGATLYIVPETLFSFPVRLIEYLKKNDITFIFWVPSALSKVSNLKCLISGHLPNLKFVLFCGEVMPTKCLNYWLKYLPNTVFSNLYGPTETTVASTYYTVDRAFSDSDHLPIGFPCRNTEILLLDQNNQLINNGDIGEICIKGTGLALAYWRDKKRTEESFIQNPTHTNFPDLIYKTGDLARLNDQRELIFIGRKDTQIKHLGHRIELGEIETACNSMIEIMSCCILYEQSQIICIYESKTNSFNNNSFKNKLINLLPKYMIPSRFHQIDEMPLNQNGKIDRVKLKSFINYDKNGG
jgi:D-alanine--poly(phosphoribitol) ligase subunit 1